MTKRPTRRRPAKPAAGADWSSPKVRSEDGVHLAGESELPVNHRLRAEALVKMGRRKDPDGLIGEDLIADTATRLNAEAAAAAGIDRPVAEQTRAQLRATAAAELVPLPAKAPRDEMIRLIEAARAAPVEPAATQEGTNQ